jgi:hypothetical protein
MDWDTQQMSGRGTVYTYSTVFHPPVPGFTMPFVVVVVELEEGPRVVSNLVEADIDAVEIGLAVEVCFVATPSGPVLPHFRPIAD